jgi:uncharacterized protein YndB with AHSA1/START domain
VVVRNNTAVFDKGLASESELVMTRVFDAPRELVFEAWTDPDRVAAWWGPKGFTTISYDMDIRPGGAYRFCMRSPDGTDYWKQGVYREVIAPERLVFTFAWVNADGSLDREMLVTVTFDAEGDKTRMTFRQGPFETVAKRDDHRRGWTSTFERFAEYLANAFSDHLNTTEVVDQ